MRHPLLFPAFRRLQTATLALGVIIFPGTACADPLEIQATPIPLNTEDVTVGAVGRLIYKGGLHLQSPNEVFGGLSALGVSDDGARFIALTDEGHRVDGKLTLDEAGNLAGIHETEIFTVPGPAGRALFNKHLADMEAMAPGVNGEVIVAFEREHRLWVYVAGSPAPRVMRPPAELKRAPRNGGIEALALLDDGRLFALTERFGFEDAVIGWVSSRRGWEIVTYSLTDGYLPTGAASLPNGDVIMVERLVTPRETSRARIRIIKKADIEPGATLEGELIAEFKAPLSVDNFEGIEAFEGADEKTRVLLVSDDNFSRRNPQRTLMMMFELQE